MTMIDLKPTMDRLLEPLYARLRKLEQKDFQPPSMSADPAVLTDGMLWYRNDLGQFRGRIGGVTKIATFT